MGRALVLLPPNGEGTARAWLRRAYWNRGALCRPHEVLAAAGQTVSALDDAGSAAPEIRADALASGAWAEAIAGDPDEAERLLHEVHRVVGPAGGSPQLAYAVAHARALALIRRGLFRDSYAPQIAAGELALRLGRADLSCGCWLNAAVRPRAQASSIAHWSSWTAGAGALAGNGSIGYEVHFLAARAYVLARLGRLSEAWAAAEQEAAAAERADAPELRATAEHDRA